MPKLSHLFDAVLIIDPYSFLILDANSNVQDVFKTEQKKLIGRSILQWLADGERKDVERALGLALRQSRGVSLACHLKQAAEAVTLSISVLWLSEQRPLLQIVIHARPASRPSELPESEVA